MGVRGYKHTEEAKRRISEARRHRMERDGFLNTPETRARISQANSGQSRPMSPEGRERHAEALRQRVRSPEHMKRFSDAGHAAMRGRTDEQSPSWTGDAVGYGGLQQWVPKHLGRPQFCEECGTTSAKKYHWTSMSGLRKRDLSDWIRLCVSCHWQRKHKTVPKKAPNGDGRFKPGQVSHNKGKAMPEFSGPNHPNWKGGVTPVHQAIRRSLPYKQWRMAVFERDHFTCVLCGFRSSYHGRGKCDIRADHIKPFHQYPELRFDIDNGRTLCVPCDLVHGWQPWRQVTEEIEVM